MLRELLRNSTCLSGHNMLTVMFQGLKRYSCSIGTEAATGVSIDYIMAFTCMQSSSFGREKEKLVVDAHFNSLNQVNMSCKVSDGRMNARQIVPMPPGKTSGAIRKENKHTKGSQRTENNRRNTRQKLWESRWPARGDIVEAKVKAWAREWEWINRASQMRRQRGWRHAHTQKYTRKYTRPNSPWLGKGRRDFIMEI